MRAAAIKKPTGGTEAKHRECFNSPAVRLRPRRLPGRSARPPRGAPRRQSCLPAPRGTRILSPVRGIATEAQTDGRGDVLLSVSHLVKDFAASSSLFGRKGSRISAVSDVGFDVRRGETFGLVGESGCGKTTTGRLVVGLEKPTSGSVSIDGADVATMTRAQRRAVRRQVQFMFPGS